MYTQISWEPDNSGYSFEKWDPRYSVIDAENKDTRALPITEDKTITAILNEPAPPAPVTTEQLCAEYNKLFYRFDGEPQHEARFIDKQKAFEARFTPEQFNLIKKRCHIVQQEQARAHGPEVLRPQAFAQGTSASAIGSRAKAGISAQPVPRGLGAITRRGGRRTAGGNVTRKRRAH
jgi:hypothetical protein